jgi:formylglycine-generating enzyme required for sulfatase activity
MVTQRMRWIKPGKFRMGSPDEEERRWENESPQHEVTLTQGFWLADTPCTQELWMAIAQSKNPSKFSGDRHPVEQVSWEDCKQWLNQLNEAHPSIISSLPTEAQWEYSCRAGSTSEYCFGDEEQELEKYAWYGKNSDSKTHPVAEKLANAWGLYDVHGNVWEWCQDWFGAYTQKNITDPIGLSEGEQRVLRGGCWLYAGQSLRSASRHGNFPSNKNYDLGFRIASSALGAEPSERASSVKVIVKPTELDRDPPEARFWKSGKKPDWVSAFGKDKYGLWCEFQVPNYWPDTEANGKERMGTEPMGFVTQRMRWIKPGTFVMGSPETTSDLWIRDETEHEVTLTQGFWMAATPCTQELWLSVDRKSNPSKFFGRRHHPVDGISWEDCQAWIKKLKQYVPLMNPSLPSEAQWEFTCRAGATGEYCFGDSENELGYYAWYGSNSGNGHHSVGQKLPNAWGVYDMHGNIWEWCHDWYGRFSRKSVVDPIGLEKGQLRVTRGGGWNSPARDLRSSCRFIGAPNDRLNFLGFRIASSALGAEPSEEAMLPVAEQGTERARIGSAEPAYEFLRSVDLDATGDRTPEEDFSELDVTAYASIRVVSDQEGYQFDRLEKPSWAVDFGSDRYGLYTTFEVKPVRQRMRWIPPGKFVMGSPAGRDYGRDDEGPEHEVIITHGYWMFDTPVTQGLWTVLMGDNPSYFQDLERPVEQVSWDDAAEFAKKLNERLAKDYPLNAKGLIDGWERLLFRLPTEAEWEYACRAGTTGDTYVGDLEILGDANAPLLDSITWYGGNSGHEFDLENRYSLEQDWLKDRQYRENAGGTRKVRAKSPNASGLYDMLGNVWEWCQDWYGDYPAARVVDPTGPTQGSSRVFRGGGWFAPARNLRSACRSWYDPGERFNFLGFRLLSSANLATESGEQV